jgi:hypothetical protein
LSTGESEDQADESEAKADKECFFTVLGLLEALD